MELFLGQICDVESINCCCHGAETLWTVDILVSNFFYLFPRVWEDQSSSEMKSLPPPPPPLSAPYWDRGRRMPRMEIAALPPPLLLPSCLWCQERGNVGHSLLLLFSLHTDDVETGMCVREEGKNTSPWKKQVACCGTKIDVSLTSFSRRRKITRA